MTKEQQMWPAGKVVIHKQDVLIRGTVLPNQILGEWDDPDRMRIKITHYDADQVEDISLVDAKAVFFVRSFTGRSKHEDLLFYDPAATASFLWARISFLDGEVIECMVPNSEEIVLAPAFFATSVDPDANNVSMYIVKKTMKHFQVLAVRHLPPENKVPLGATSYFESTSRPKLERSTTPLDIT